MLVAKVDADKHRSLGERFGVTGFPTLKFFPAKAGKPEEVVEDYNGGREAADFVTFLNERSGAERTPEGGLLPTAGRVAAFDALAAKFAESASAADRALVVELAKSTAAKLETAELRAKADAYLRVMAKASEKEGYVAKETKRLTGMAGAEGVAKAKKIELAQKLNVLKAFVAAAADAGSEL